MNNNMILCMSITEIMQRFGSAENYQLYLGRARWEGLSDYVQHK